MATPTVYKHEVGPHGVLDNNPSDLQSLFFILLESTKLIGLHNNERATQFLINE
jgi:hypothetical protein